MKANEYSKLENDLSFKKTYLGQTLWWKNILMIAPICFLFAGLVGIIYLFNSDMLVSFYTIPYLVLFVVGTIWIKTIKKHIQKEAMAKDGAFRICLAAPIGDRNGYTYAVFVNNTRRYDKYYITNLAKDISLLSILEKNDAPFRKKAILIHDEEQDADIYMRAYPTKEITKKNAGWSTNEGYFPVLYIDEVNVPILKRKDLTQKL